MVIDVTILMVAILICASAGLIARMGLRTYRHTAKLKSTPGFDELMKTLELVMANEIASYERLLDYSTDGVDLDGFITNSQFVNIYNDLSKQIIYGLSDDFYYLMSTYWTEGEVQSYISQRVYLYLINKAVPVEDEEQEEAESPADYGDDFGEY